MKKLMYTLVVIILSGLALQAQNDYKPWIIGVSTNYTDFNTVGKSIGDQFTNADWMGKHIPSQMRIGRMINPSVNISAIVSNVTLNPEKLNKIPLDQYIENSYFYKVGVQAEYSFTNDYLLSHDSWFDPYIFTGLSGSSIDVNTYFSVPVGIGFNLWATDYLGVNFQGNYEYLVDFDDYMHYSAGIVVKFGNMIDKDNDRVPDRFDMCPEITGVETFQGCPDTDGDGVVDSLDRCPEVYGPASSDGCPDMDGDGVIDADDHCPNVKGTAALNGCPDTDNDGVLDKNDHCPNIPGKMETNGCPDTDNDGVPDEWDLCPNDAGPKSNGGCPVKEEVSQTVIVPIEMQEQIKFHQKSIEFELNSAKLRETSSESLDEIAKIMKEYPESRYTVYGYTDDTGSEEYNFQLSKERAESVKQYLTEHGIASKRLETAGFGEQNPIVPNNSEENRKQNRRVEINVIKE